MKAILAELLNLYLDDIKLEFKIIRNRNTNGN